MRSPLRLLAALAAAATPIALLAGAPAGGSSTVRVPGSVLPQLRTARSLGQLRAGQRLVVAVTVKHDMARLRQAEAALYDPSSPSYHHFLTPAQFRARYGTPPAQIAAIRRFVTAKGLQLVNPDGLGDYVMATGTAAQVERTFGVTLERYGAADGGKRFFANTTAPTVPSGLGIDAVLGLESLDAYHTASQHSVRAATAQGQCVASTCTGLMRPRDLWKAYQMPDDNLGQGQTIGIIGEGRSADVIQALRDFEDRESLPQVPVQVYHTDPGDKSVPESQRDDSGRIEWELDTQASTGMAPDVSQVRLYFGSSLQLTQLTGALATWANDPVGPLQASASLGACEDDPALHPLLGAAQRASSAQLVQAAMEGRTLFASTGDTGSGCAVGAAGVNGVTYGPVPTPEYPSVDPNAVGVGGTILYTDGSDNRAIERAWDHTGGGPSKWIAQPDYQKGASAWLDSNACLTKSDGTPYGTPGQLCRGVSDVAALSGDATISVQHRLNDEGVPSPIEANGYDIVDYCPPDEPSSTTSAVLPDCAYGSKPGTTTRDFSEGGTSLASPLWLGMWARVQAHHDAVDPTTLEADPTQSLGFANPLIYKLAQGADTKRDFYDVTLGANPLPAGPGWDFPTGWGSPNVAFLTADASGDGSTAPKSTVAPSGTATDPPELFASPPAGPSCSYLFYDPSDDAADLANSQNDQLDIVEGNFGLTPDGTKLRVVLNIKDLSKSIPAGSDYLDYEAYWNSTPAGASSPTTYAVDVQVDALGNVTYADGTMAVTEAGGTTNYQFTPNPTSTATGSFGSGPNGAIEVDVPLGEVGSPKLGDVLSQAGAYSADGINAVATGLGFIVDQDGPAPDYALGQPTCIDGGTTSTSPGGGTTSGGGGTTTGPAQSPGQAPSHAKAETPPARGSAPGGAHRPGRATASRTAFRRAARHRVHRPARHHARRHHARRR